MGLLVSNIQRYAIHDGGGIRTTIFFQGCPLACSWCHNPETRSFEAKDRLREISPRELARLVMRDAIFFGDRGGGVTLSGGEPLAGNMACIIEFLKILKKNSINVACDTCGAVPWENFAAVLPYVDTFLYDIKAVSKELHIRHTGLSNEDILANLERLCTLARVWLRIPVIGGFNNEDEMPKIIALAKRATQGSKVSLLPYHEMGRQKWAGIGENPPVHNFYTPSSGQMQEIMANWKEAGFDTEIGG